MKKLKTNNIFLIRIEKLKDLINYEYRKELQKKTDVHQVVKYGCGEDAAFLNPTPTQHSVSSAGRNCEPKKVLAIYKHIEKGHNLAVVKPLKISKILFE